MTTDAPARLTRWLRTRLEGCDDVCVEGLTELRFGHSADLMTFTLRTETMGRSERRECVIRVRPTPPGLLEPYDLQREFTILKALEQTPVRAPTALWFEGSAEVLGRQFYVMDHVAGTVYEMHPPTEAKDTPARVRSLCRDMAEQLSAVHNVAIDTVGLSDLGDGTDYLGSELDRWSREMHRVQRGPLPALERLHAELVTAAPSPCSRIGLVHGDAKPGNFAFREGQVSALFDWELAGIGDPLTDIGWMELVWAIPIGIPGHCAALSIDEFIAHYEHASGISVNNRPWYRALAAFKMAVICLVGSSLADSGASDDPRLLLNASAIPHFTQTGLRDLGVNEVLEDGPVLPREERAHELQAGTHPPP